jgi:hypothetical protein
MQLLYRKLFSTVQHKEPRAIILREAYGVSLRWRSPPHHVLPLPCPACAINYFNTPTITVRANNSHLQLTPTRRFVMMPFPFSLLSPFNQIFEKFVNQPVTDWHNFYSPNFVFQYNPEDQPVEQHVLRKVGSYGRQLGLVIGMIQLIRSQLPIASSALSESERELVKDFDALVEDVNAAISDFREAQKPTVAQIQALKASNDSRLKDVADALQH